MNETTVASRANDGMDRMGSGSLWYAWDIALLGLLFLFGAFEYGYSVISYIGGLRNDGSLAFGAVVWFVLLFPLAGICLLLVLVRILAFWPKHIRDHKRLRTLQVGVIIGLIVYLAVPFTPIVPPGSKTYTWGFRKHVRANVDVHAIQKWLETVDPNTRTGELMQRMEWQEQRNDWPQAVVRLDPEYVTLALDEDGRPTVRIGWSGLDEFWGLTVGHEEMEIPETQLRTKEILPGGRVIFNDGEYRLPVAPGAYVWHNIELSDGARMPAND